ncbi:uncharacterized protein NKAPD1-like [Antedon mediterranea]|uniref:uncharacterized protein NKAPD1-like n=1 Tax=Antedon mediterranea TaxID=105859 RepID=UPI003AF8E590
MDSNGKITVRYLDRKFVKNVIRHTDVHNRRQEQDEMWRARKSELKETSRKRKHSSSHSRSRQKKELNDDYHRLANNVKREITKCNPLNSDRWSHNGFLELYPEDEECEEEKKITKSKHKRIKKKKSKKKRQQSDSSDSTITTDSSSNEGQTSEEERKKHKRSRKHRKKRKKKHKKAEK